MPGNFIESHPLAGAFLGHQMQRLVDLIVTQGDALLTEGGVSTPARASSTLLLLDERGPLSAADIARELDQPHQLATQRIDMLIAMGVLNRVADPKDGRRKILVLTKEGEAEIKNLRQYLERADEVFEGLYKDIGLNLSEAALAAIAALTASSLSERGELSKTISPEMERI